MPLEPATNRRSSSSNAAEAVNINGTVGDQRKIDRIQNTPHPIDRGRAAVRNRKTKMGDPIVLLVRESPKFIVIANKWHAGVVFLVLFLQVDERPHAGGQQRRNPLAMIRWFWSAWVRPSEQPIIDDPISSMAWCWFFWMQKFCGNGQGRSRAKSARIPTSRQEGIQGIQNDLVQKAYWNR